MTGPSTLADCCPECHPGDVDAVAPLVVITAPDGSLVAVYVCPACEHCWWCSWDAEAAGWTAVQAQAGSPA